MVGDEEADVEEQGMAEEEVEDGVEGIAVQEEGGEEMKGQQQKDAESTFINIYRS